MAIIYSQERINLIMINFVHFLLLIQTSLSLFFLLPSSSSAFFLLGPAVIRVFSSTAQERLSKGIICRLTGPNPMWREVLNPLQCKYKYQIIRMIYTSDDN